MRGKNVTERIGALLLAVILTISGMIPQTVITSKAAAGDPIEVEFLVKDKDANAELKNFELLVKDENDEIQLPTDSVAHVFTLEEGKEYTYSVSKSGYTAIPDTTFTAAAGVPSVEIVLSAEEIDVKTDTISMNVGDAQTVIVSNSVTENEYSYQWSSNDKKVASVQDGVITAHGEGSATVTVTSMFNGTQVKAKDITVTVQLIPVSLVLTVDPSSGEDLTSVTCKVDGVPDDATGHLIFYINTVEKGTLDIGTQGKVWIYSTEDDLKGELKFKVKYQGDHKYKESLSQEVGTSFKKKVELIAPIKEEEVQERTIGKADWNREIDFKVKEEKQTTRTITYSSSNEAVATVDQITGTVTPKSNVGTTIITATAGGNDEYTEQSVRFKLHVSKFINHSDITWSDTAINKKVYDGETSVKFKGTIKETQGQGEVEEIEVTANLNDAGIGVGKDITVEDGEYESSKKNYILEINASNNTVSGAFDVTPRPVYLKIKLSKGTVEYGQDLKEAVKKIAQVSWKNENGKEDGEDQSGFLGEDDEKAPEIDASIPADANVGEVITVTPDKRLVNQVQGNYELKFKEEDKGTIDIVKQNMDKQTMINNILATGTQGSVQVIVDAVGNLEHIFAQTKGGLEEPPSPTTLSLQVKDNAYYDTVFIQLSGSSSAQTASDVDLSSFQTDGSVDGITIYLGKAGTQSETDAVDFDLLTIDNTAPDVEFTGLQRTVLSDFAGSISFGMFQKEAWNQSLTVTENENGSGVEKVQYYIWEIDDPSKVKEEDVKEKDKDISAWTNAKRESDKTYTIPMTKDPKYCLILVKTKDNLGNCMVYTSNGIVVESVSPSVGIEGIIEGKIYPGDVEYTLNIDDRLGELSAALNRMEIEVIKDGNKKVKSDLDYTNSFEIDFSKGSYTYKELQANSNVKIDGKILAKDCNSNDVKVKITVYDNAGNKSLEWERSILMDSTAPKVTVSYDKNDPQNEVYFQDSRIMNVQYQERNFDINNARFSFEVNSEKFTNLSMDEINSMDAKYGIRAVWLEKDIDPGKQELFKDDRINTIQLIFTGNSETGGCDYSNFAFAFKDKGGLTCEDRDVVFAQNTKAPRTFSIDSLSPDISVAYAANGMDVTEQVVSGTLFSNVEVTATVKIKERNFWQDGGFSEQPEQMVVDVAATEAPGGILDFNGQAQQTVEWNENAGEYTTVFRFNKDGNYTHGFTYTDLSGRAVTYAKDKFTYDANVPIGTVSLKGNVWGGFLSIITFGIFDQSPVDVRLTGEDATAGVESIAYYKYGADVESRDEFTGLTMEQLAAVRETDWAYQTALRIEQNEQAIIYGRVIDRAGNVTYLNSDGVISDDTSPDAPNIQITMENPTHGIYNTNVPFHISVTDPTAGNTYAGLQSVYYEVRKDGAMTQAGDFNSILQPATKRVKNLEGDGIVQATLNNSNDVVIYVKAVDNAGNVSEAEKALKVDITEPTIQVTYDLNDPANGKYYNRTRTATISVRERNFDTAAVRFNITNTDGTHPSISDWSIGAGTGVSDDTINTCTVTFAGDGDYTLTVNCTDLAGNDSNYTQTDEFTIDQTVPTIQVSYDNNSAQTPGYYNANRTATVTVNEHNFNAADVNAAVTASLQGQGGSVPGVGGWSNQGDIHTASVIFTSDADYTFDIQYTDMAGNAAADYTQDRFTVDQTKPEIEMFDIKDKSANNGEVAPGIKYSDVNYTENGVKLTLKGVNHGNMNLDGERSSIPNGQSIKLADFKHTEEVDDLYTLKAEVTDKAGNKTEKQVKFSVNRFGSVYVLSNDTKKLLEDYYTNEEQDITVTEINVDTLEFNGITYGRDGELVKLKKGNDYTVKTNGGEDSWKEYQYTIKKENFEQEGNYTVTIDSKDRALNTVNNKIKKEDIKFVIDKTEPTVVITGVEDGKQYRADARDMTVNAVDNIAMSNVDIYVDDASTPTKSYDTAAIEQVGGKLTYTIENASNFQNVKAVAEDAAGNKAETTNYRVLVTSNLLVQYYSNKPLLAGSAVVVMGAVAGAYALMQRRRKIRK